MNQIAKETIRGRIYGVAGPTVLARGMSGARMYSTCLVGRDGLLGEVIRISGDVATIQVYEDTSGLSLGEEVLSRGEPFMVTLGPGLLTGIFDGIQRPLQKMAAEGHHFIARGLKTEPLDAGKVWDFEPCRKPGDEVREGDVIGTVQETERIEHRIMVPPGMGGTVKELRKGGVSGDAPVCILSDGTEIGLYQRWPARRTRPFGAKLKPDVPFVTGQRVFDTLFPVAEGGVAVVPGGFGTGKTVVEQTIAKFARSDIVIYIGCGERGNEMTEVLTDFPLIEDPETGLPLSLRTVIVVNTSNMPVAAREASIFTGITVAEYFRDMGYRVSLMADSLSRWAEALREISSRLEEMPGEEGFPPYLATRMGSFYERAGKVKCLGTPERTGSVTIISAISPPGGDFSEPVTQASLRFAGTLWTLDKDLAYRRHFPAVSWQSSFSLYYKGLRDWFEKEVAPDIVELRSRLLSLLQKESELKEIVQIIGMEALQETDRLTLEVAAIVREAFLRQNVFNEADAFNTFDKQCWMLRLIFAFMDRAERALKDGFFIENIIESPVRTALLKMEFIPNDRFPEKARELMEGIEKEFTRKDTGKSG